MRHQYFFTILHDEIHRNHPTGSLQLSDAAHGIRQAVRAADTALDVLGPVAMDSSSNKSGLYMVNIRLIYG